MELIIGDTQLKCYEDGRIERLLKTNSFKEVVGSINKWGYLQMTINYKNILCHRIIYKAFNPEWDLQSPLMIDHINRDKKDNRIENLRPVTNQQNQFNRNAKGYNLMKNGFQAQIRVNDKRLSRWFPTEAEAREWYLQQKAIIHLTE
jgi:hypothetical protein